MIKLLSAILLIISLSSFSQERKSLITSQSSLNLPVIDLDISEKFYTSIFHFETLKMPDENFRSVKRWLKIADKVELHLEFGRTRIIEKEYKKVIHIYWECPKEQFEKLEKYFAELKIQIVVEKGSEKESDREPNKIYLNDPDGYIIQIKETTK